MTNIINKVIKNGTEYQIYASGGAAITVDSELSTTSTNPAQNKVITTAINSKAADNAVVKLTGNQTVAGTKTFSTSPVVPSKNSAASSSNKTVIATEAQVALKQDALTLPSSPTSGHIVTWGANNKTLADGGSIPTVNNSTITFTQGGVSKGTITTNQSSASTIALDAGGNYDNITKSEIQTGTASTQRTISASVIKSALPRISSLPNNILISGEIWAGNLSDYKAMGDGRPSTTLFFCIDDGWTPGADTIAYYPLTSESTVNDTSGNNKNLTNNGSVTFGTQGGVDCATFSGSNYLNRSESLFTGSGNFTVNLWFRRTGTYDSHRNIFSVGTANGTNNFIIWIDSAGSTAGHLMVGGWSNDRDTGYFVPQDSWLNLVYTHSGGTIKVYVNNSLKYTGTVSFGLQSGFTGVGCGLMNNNCMIGNLSNIIVENKVWAADEVDNYFNKTKENYGIS